MVSSVISDCICFLSKLYLTLCCRCFFFLFCGVVCHFRMMRTSSLVDGFLRDIPFRGWDLMTWSTDSCEALFVVESWWLGRWIPTRHAVSWLRLDDLVYGFLRGSFRGWVLMTWSTDSCETRFVVKTWWLSRWIPTRHVSWLRLDDLDLPRALAWARWAFVDAAG